MKSILVYDGLHEISTKLECDHSRYVFYNLENNMRVYLYTALVIAAFYRTTNNNGI